jgi:adenosylmethionine-8-amino-7-oxononanoate aminotransferase
MGAVELVKNKETRESWGADHPFIKGLGLRTQEAGLITRVWDVLHLAPPLVMTEPEMELAVAVIDDCLTELEAEFAAEIS